MPEYTSLKGFDSISNTDLQTVIEQNLISFFDWGLLDKGGFSNVTLSQNDIRGSSKSTLRKVIDPNYTDGKVWTTFHQNIVWESGLTFGTQPINISGVYVNNSFKTTTTSGYEHYVDYPNGRVVFNSAMTGVVKMEYSYKSFLVTKAEAVPIFKEMQTRVFDLTATGYSNSVSSGDWSRIERAKVQIPIIAFEVSPRVTLSPTEIGGGSHWAHTDVLCHVFADNDETVKKLSWIMAMQKEKTIMLYDVDMIAASGKFPLDYRGALSSGALTYPDIIEDFKYNKLFIADTSIQGPFRLGNIYHGVVKLKTDVQTIT